MFIAIAEHEGQVAQHFGKNRSFVLAEIQQRRIAAKTFVKTPDYCSEKNILLDFLKKNQVTLLIVGGMGQRACDAIRQSGIQVLRGAEGEIGNILQLYLDGKLVDRQVTCHSDCSTA